MGSKAGSAIEIHQPQIGTRLVGVTSQEFRWSERLANWQNGVGHRVSGRTGGMADGGSKNITPGAPKRVPKTPLTRLAGLSTFARLF
jgi:hypothetical protein